ncbi:MULTISPECIES: wax ester/triacylglycerol synthase family O-acyltransferase [unclassified Pseudonocardia]|uniref:wax ester/triacylglycerol synthase family O-acyltransferase n=1 Tax=unclassified Pseudonocardia TaxID=2619320 RepID=UPI0002FBDC04|nr:wax ester/triacylglycerol synthase family O-acyltransferase [Pseudonocardia sp. Ae707_Ps1]OLM16792.1 hypothetical protein Ae707Ps1_1050c [Pseudonocardia sp. Ae707_Ps1]
MPLVPATDAMYLWGESSASPNHVVALQIFRPPEGAPAELVDELYARMTVRSEIKPEFRRRPYRSLGTAGQFAWAEEPALDTTLHVRRAALPRPGRMRELLEYVATFHETPLPRDRPLWEARLVEGLDDGRFALLTKMHHSQFDGVNMGRHLLGGLSTDPSASGGRAAWMGRTRTGAPPEPPGLTDRLLSALGATRDVARSAPTLLQGAADVLGPDRAAPAPFSAPPSMFNGPVSAARRFAGDAWTKDRLRAVAKRTGTTTNDITLAMCAGALRSYLLREDALPEQSLVAMVPISFDPYGAATRSGNEWAAVLCDLGTDTADPAERLQRIHESTARSKERMAQLDPVSAATVSMLTLGGMAFDLLPGVPGPPRPPFNLVISSIPAVPRRLYLDGCELTDNYPVSVVVDGQALNITTVSYADEIAFGISGCRRSVPHLQRLLGFLEDALAALEALAPPVGTPGAP